MAQTIKLKNSGTSGNTPSSLVHGELALNYADGKLFYKNSSNNIVELATGGGSGSFLPLSGGTLTGNLSIPNGGVGSPAIRFASDTNTGIYRGGEDNLIIATGGANRLTVTSAGIFSSANVYSGTTGSYRNFAGTWAGTTGTANNGFYFLNTANSNTTKAMELSHDGNVVFAGTATVGGNVSLDANDAFVYLSNVGTGNSGIYVRGRGTQGTLRSHTTTDFRWEIGGSERATLNTTGFNTVGTLTASGNINTTSGHIQINGASVIQSNFRITPHEHVIFSSTTGYIQHPSNSSANAWAYGVSGGGGNPGVDRNKWGLHYYNGTSWSNPFHVDASGNAVFTGEIQGATLDINGNADFTGQVVIVGPGTSGSTLPLNIKDNNATNILRVRDDGVVLIDKSYLYVTASAGAYVQHSLRARGGITNDGGNDLSISSGSSQIDFNNKNFANVGAITATADDNALTVSSTTNGAGVEIRFTDQTPTSSQHGFIEYRHSDTASYGGSDVFTIKSDQTAPRILADGLLMFKSGLALKPASGTGAGTTLITSGRALQNITSISCSGEITASDLTITGGSDGEDIYINNTSPTLGFTDSNSFSDSNDVYLIRGASTGKLQFQFKDDSAGTTTQTFLIDESGNTDIAGTLTATRFIQSSSNGNTFYAAQFSRSGSTTTTPDIWGTNSTFVIGTSSTTEALGFSGANAEFYGNAEISGTLTVSTAGSTIKSPLYMGAQNSTGEGGEITLSGSNSNTGHTLDTVNGSFRIFDNNGTLLSGNSGYGLSVVNGYRVNGTQVITSSRNLTNIGTISSGAITSSGQILTTIESSTAIKSRFIMGKASGSTANGNLYLQYGSSDTVFIGAGSGGAGLDIAGTLKTGRTGINTASVSDVQLKIKTSTNDSTDFAIEAQSANGNSLFSLDGAGEVRLAGNVKMSGTTIITSGRGLTNLTLSHGTGGTRFETNNWHYSSDNNARFYFEASGRTFYRSTTHQFRNTNSSTVFNISSTGGIHIATNGDEGNASSTEYIKTNGTVILTSSRELQNVSGDISMFTNDSNYATQTYVTNAISNLVDSAPSTLDTLNELAAALGDDASFSTTVTNSIATKLPLAGGTLTGTLNSKAINMQNHQLYGVNNLRFNDPGVNEGIKWDGGNQWQIYESPDDQSNASGNLQFTSGSGGGTRRATLDTSGNWNLVTGGLRIGGTAVITSGKVLQNVTGNISMFTNNSGYITNSTASLDASKITSGTLSNSRLSTDMILSGGAPRYRLTETGVTNTPNWWMVADGGNYSIRLNNTGTYPLTIVTNTDNNAVTSVNLGYSTHVQGAITNTSTISAGSTIHRGNMTIDSQEIDVSSGDLALDVAGNITLDAGGGNIDLKEGGTTFGRLQEMIGGLGISAGSSPTFAQLLSPTKTLFFGHIELGDSKHIQFGNSGGDLQIYHDGSDSYIKEYGTGALKILTNGLRVRNAADDEDIIVANQNGAVDLYYDNAKKLNTKTDGVDITGELQADSLDVDGDVDIDGNTVITGSGSSGNAFQVNRGNNGNQSLRIQNTGEIVTSSNYVYHTYTSGKSFYSQGEAVFRGGISNDQGDLEVKDNLDITGGALEISGTSVITSGRTLQNVSGNISMFTNDSGYITSSSIPSSLPANGGNADTVDSLHASSFLRSDANDTMNNTLTFASGSGFDLATHDVYGSMRVIRNNKSGSDGMYIGYLNNNSGLTRIFGGGATSGGIYVTGSGANAIKYNNSSTFWHAGNDGSGSGLDADTLDGYQSGYFATQGNLGNYLPLSGGTMTGTITSRDLLLQSDYHLQRSSHRSGHLEGSYNNIGANDTKSNPIYTIGSSYNPNDNTLGNMYGVGYSHHNASFISFTGNSGWGFYVAADGDARVFLNGSNGQISSTGQHYVGSNVVWNAGNDGSGSGLDADLLDGQHGSYYAPASTVPTVHNGTLTISSGNSLTGSGTFTANSSANTTVTIAVDTPDDAGSGGWYRIVAWNNQLIYDDSVRLHGAGYLKASYLNMSHGASNRTSDTVFYSSTDDYIRKNTQSGFRTSLDVYSKSEVNGLGFIKQGTNAVGNSSFSDAIGEGFRFQRVTGGSNRATTSHHNVLQIPNTSGDIYLAQMAFGTDSSATKLAWRSKGTSFGSWYDIWHAGNDGSGSGLDADTLDGLNSATSGNSVIVKTQGNGYLAPLNWIQIGSGTGLFNSNGAYFFENTTYGWNSRSRQNSNSSIRLQLTNGSNVGWFYANSSGTQGFLTSGGSWRLQVDNTQGNSLKRDGSHKIWDAGNDGSGSGLDADTVDGLQASQFLRSDADDSVTGNKKTTLHQLRFTGVGTNSNAGNDGYAFYQEAGAWTSPFPNLIMGYHTGVKFGAHKSYGGIRFYNDHPYTSSAAKIFSVGEGDNNVRIQLGDLYFSSTTSNKAWHAGNDGAGSGLDADTLDGYNTLENGANVVLRSNGSGYLNIQNWINIGNTGFYSSTNGHHFYIDGTGYIAKGGSSSQSRIIFQMSTGTNQGIVLANSSGYVGFQNASGSWLFQARSNGNLYKGNGTGLIWHSANDGSGSGLDADTVDGVHASSLYGVTSVATGGGLTGGTITGQGTISHADTSSVSNVNNSGNTFIQDITFDTYGHVTSVTSATATSSGGGGASSSQTVTARVKANRLDYIAATSPATIFTATSGKVIVLEEAICFIDADAVSASGYPVFGYPIRVRVKSQWNNSSDAYIHRDGGMTFTKEALNSLFRSNSQSANYSANMKRFLVAQPRDPTANNPDMQQQIAEVNSSDGTFNSKIELTMDSYVNTSTSEDYYFYFQVKFREVTLSDITGASGMVTI